MLFNNKYTEMEKLTKKDKFILKCKNKFGDKFTYGDYINSQTKISILCNLHKEYFLQVPAEHLRGKNGCKLCTNKHEVKPLKKTYDYKNQNKIYDNEKFINLAINKHGDKYDYSNVKYTKSDLKIKIICSIHGEFEQYPYSHLRGKGCKKCGKEVTKNKLSLNDEEFIGKSKKTHGDKYNYSSVDYKNSHTKVNIICDKHGMFEQLPYDHISGHGCEKCISTISNQELEINEFLKSLGLKTITSSRSIIKPNQLDIYIPSHNLAIEYNGLYWHSEEFLNKDYHLNKTIECEKQDIRLIHIFEDEWLFKQDVVKSRLMNMLGLTKNKIYGRKCVIKNVTLKESALFLEKNHIQGVVNTSIRIGLYYNEELVSLMCFNKPRLGIGTTYDGYELSRFCNKLNTNVIGGADKLLKYCIKTYQPKEILSYADKRWSQGDLYEKLGFIKSHVNKPNYYYVIGKNRKHRFGFRKEILRKQGFDTKNKTEHEIMMERKIYRIYDCGTITYKLNLT
jgi:hypothetical protein